MDFYAELELSPGASDRDINLAYKRLALRYHPDKNPGDEAAHRRFLRVKEAHQALLDPQVRDKLDARRRAQEAQVMRRANEDEGRKRMRAELLERERQSKVEQERQSSYEAELSRQRAKQAWWEPQHQQGNTMVRLVSFSQTVMTEQVIRALVQPLVPKVIWPGRHGSAMLQMSTAEEVAALLKQVNEAQPGSALADYAAESMETPVVKTASRPSQDDAELEALEERVLGRLLRLDGERKSVN